MPGGFFVAYLDALCDTKQPTRGLAMNTDQHSQDLAAQLERDALESLRRGPDVRQNSERTNRILSLLVLPAFEDRQAYYLDARPDSKMVVCSRVTWSATTDLPQVFDPIQTVAARQKTPRPTLLEEQAIVPEEFAGKVRKLINETALPLDPAPGTFGTDGVNYELRVGELFHSVVYRWWVNPPSRWASLSQVANEVIETVVKALE